MDVRPTPVTARAPRWLLMAAVVGLGGAIGGVIGAGPEPLHASVALGMCVAPDPDPPAYYQLELVSTRRVPGTARSRGTGDVTFAQASPFGIALAADGSYHYDVSLEFERLPDRRDGVYAVWLTSTDLSQVVSAGVLDAGQRELAAVVDWNQFLVVVSLEPDAKSVGDRWSGPIVMRGISKSGLMHTMAGHGPFEEENCAAYGFS